MTKKEAFEKINYLQNEYVDELISLIKKPDSDALKEINFTSDTGTGKTNMMALMCNKMPECFFIITSLSKGQLHTQIADKLAKLCTNKNYLVYGVADYKSNSVLQDIDILQLIPNNKKLIWLRDEGHINTNKWQELLCSKAWKIINISATNKEGTGVRCNFIETPMLRTVYQQTGTPEIALEKLIEIKKQHAGINNYNPCAIMRCIDNSICNRIIEFCKKNSLTYISLIDENHDILELCEDDNPIDVIINKFKIVEGIDIRRAHVLYMDNEPRNVATTIQVIGRCRRNALLYRQDIDIFKNKKLFDATKKCYVYYNVVDMKIAEDESGNLCAAFCNIISCEKLKPGSIIEVRKGEMKNGLTIAELAGQSGKFKIEVDPDTGFNVVNPASNFYATESQYIEPEFHGHSKNELYSNMEKRETLNWATGEKDIIEGCYLPDPIVSGKAKSLREYMRGLVHQKFYSKDYIDTYFEENEFVPYNQIISDREEVILGIDQYKQIKSSDGSIDWIPDEAVTSKVTKYSKLNSFLRKKYEPLIHNVIPQLYNGKNHFNFNSKANACLGYCVEYYAKYLVYGEKYFRSYIDRAKIESKVNNVNDFIIIRACMLKYRANMVSVYGSGIGKLIRTISVEQLIANDYAEFVKTVIELGTRTADFIKKEFNISGDKSVTIYDPDLSTEHISALCDFVKKDKIVDIKCTNNITLQYVLQVLAYHYLSTKRSDLNIQEVIVYDAVKNKCVRIKI